MKGLFWQKNRNTNVVNGFHGFPFPASAKWFTEKLLADALRLCFANYANIKPVLFQDVLQTALCLTRIFNKTINIRFNEPILNVISHSGKLVAKFGREAEEMELEWMLSFIQPKFFFHSFPCFYIPSFPNSCAHGWKKVHVENDRMNKGDNALNVLDLESLIGRLPFKAALLNRICILWCAT